MIPAPMAGDDSIPVVGASGCHRLQWPKNSRLIRPAWM